jgi:hypothetical protein
VLFLVAVFFMRRRAANLIFIPRTEHLLADTAFAVELREVLGRGYVFENLSGAELGVELDAAREDLMRIAEAAFALGALAQDDDSLRGLRWLRRLRMVASL